MKLNSTIAVLYTSFLFLVCAAAPCAGQTPEAGAAGPSSAIFDWFEYSGTDKVFEKKIRTDEFRNPILAGFYPDPSIVRVGGDYYLVNSTFGFYPGIPVFHSRDLVNWEQIGNVIDRPDMLDLDGVNLSTDGVYAPTISYFEGTFYVINTCVRCGGNFVVKAKDPAGPWSDPVWLPDVGGIDPSLFYEGGRLYIVNNDAPEGEPLYQGHRAIWIREVDPKTFKPVSKAKMIVNGGTKIEQKPVWIEGPHIYKVGAQYYLSAAEGGTEVNHSQVIFRSDSIWGPYVPWEKNPILTQRDLPSDRRDPVTSTGHADLFTDTKGNWWAVFLGTRTYDINHFNTGRETFLLPVEWTDGWPVILEPGKPVPYTGKLPSKAGPGDGSRPVTGNLTLIDNFDGPELENYWTFVRTPRSKWWRFADGRLLIEPRNERLGDTNQPSVIARRLQHMYAHATVPMTFTPGSAADEAGIIAFQNDAFYYAFGLGRNDRGSLVLRVRHRDGTDHPARGKVIAEREVRFQEGAKVYLRIDVRGPKAIFSYSTDGNVFKKFVKDADARTLSTAKAGGFVGAMIGMYAEGGELAAKLADKDLLHRP